MFVGTSSQILMGKGSNGEKRPPESILTGPKSNGNLKVEGKVPDKILVIFKASTKMGRKKAWSSNFRTVQFSHIKEDHNSI